MSGLAVRGTFSPARAWRPAVVTRLARTLGLRTHPLLSSMQLNQVTLPAHDVILPLHSRTRLMRNVAPVAEVERGVTAQPVAA